MMILFSSAVDTSTTIVGYLALFGGVGFVFVFANLLLGRFLRPHDPHEEKQEIYECGEPAIGSSFVQFDLRFYVVALIFIIFDVEVAFLFPWATIFGKANELANTKDPIVAVATDGTPALTESSSQLLTEMGVRGEVPASELNAAAIRDGVDSFATLATYEVLVFFAILLVGYAYVWKMGALDWVRATASQQTISVEKYSSDKSSGQESVLSV